MVLQPEDEDFAKAFADSYKQEFGFVLEGKDTIVDDIRSAVFLHIPYSQPGQPFAHVTSLSPQDPRYWQIIRLLRRVGLCRVLQTLLQTRLGLEIKI